MSIVRNNKRQLLGLLISFGFVLIIVHQVNITEAWNYVLEVKRFPLLIIIPVSYVCFVIRAIRWKIILTGNNDVRLRALFSILFIGYAVNCIFPAKMGEIYRANLLGKINNIGGVEAFASIVLERLFDGTVLFSLLLMFIYKFYASTWVLNLLLLTGFIFIGGLLFLVIYYRFSNVRDNRANVQGVTKLHGKYYEKLLNKLCDWVKCFRCGLCIFDFPARLFQVYVLSLMIWLAEAVLIFCVMIGFSLHVDMVSSIFILCVISFSTLIPSGPASVGPYQYGYIISLGMFNIPSEKALAASIVTQSIQIFLVCLTGLFFFWKDYMKSGPVKGSLEGHERFRSLEK